MSQNKIINYNRGRLIDHLNVRRYDSYSRALRNTLNKLREGGYGEIDFELHVPMIVKSKLLRIAINELLPNLRSSRSFLIRSYYGNRFTIESEHMRDVKNTDDYKDLPIISTNEGTFAGEMGQYIKDNL